VLKKAGIVVATAAAGLLAAAPLAFAGDGGHHHHGGGDQSNSNQELHQGLVNVSDNNVNVPIQACGNNVPVNVLGIQVSDVTADITAALGLLAPAEAKSLTNQGDDRSCASASAAGDTNTQAND
jgi:hypothetical protein